MGATVSAGAQPGELLTAEQVAAVLNVHPRTVYEYGREGRLSVVRLSPRMLRYRRASVEALVAGELPADLDVTQPEGAKR